jgi:hypothetical protein
MNESSQKQNRQWCRRALWIWLICFVAIAAYLVFLDIDAFKHSSHTPPYWQQFLIAAIPATLLLGLWMFVRCVFASWRNFRRSLVGLAVFATLVAIVYTEEDWRGKRAWDNCKHELEAKGAVLDWDKFIPPPVPDDQNFFTVNTNFYLRFVRLQTKEQGDALNQVGEWLHIDYGSNAVDLAKSNPLVAKLNIVASGQMSPAPAKNCLAVPFNSPNASREVQELIQTTVGRSANGPQGFKFSELSLSKLAPAQIFIQAEVPPSLGDLQHLIPGDLITNIGRLEVKPTVDPKAFEVRFVGGSISASADYLKWSDKFVPAFDDVRAALKRPYAIIPGDYSISWRMPIPNFVLMRWLAQTLASRAQCYLLLGQPEKALPELVLIHDLCRILEKPPTGQPETLVEAMINVAITGVYVNTIQDGLRLHAWQEPQLVAIQKQLQETRLLPFVNSAFRMEQVSIVSIGEKSNARQIFTGEGFGADRKKAWYERLWSHRYDTIPDGWKYQNIKYAVALEQPLIDCFDPANAAVYPKKLEAASSRIEKSFEHWSLFQYLAAIAIPNFTKAFQNSAYNQTLVNQAQVVCALERYKFENQAYPATLNELVPQFLEKIPLDLVGGQPLHYRRTEDGKFLLYSVGWNETDDGGVTVRDKSGYADKTKGDWVWQYPAK